MIYGSGHKPNVSFYILCSNWLHLAYLIGGLDQLGGLDCQDNFDWYFRLDQIFFIFSQVFHSRRVD